MTRLAAVALCALMLAPVCAFAESGKAEAPRTIIVMDGSGSMWGQIDGRAKLEIARDTVARVLATMPPAQELGLIAYGHRRKGDCGDIELVVPPAAGTADQIAQRVNTMRFLGKTPLSAAVRQAADALRYGEEAATVVLVTDGLETCDADPCALGRELEEGGLDFTAHVIGFGLTQDEGAQVACLAQATGGRYIEARNADDLATALSQTVSAAPAIAPEPVAEPASKPTPLPAAGLVAPDSAPIGSMVEVGWTVSESSPYDTITIGHSDDESYDFYVYASQGNPLKIQMPGAEGTYELRYVSQDHTIVARRPIKVTPAPLSLSAVDTANVGQLVPVTWQGPDADYDTIQVQLPGGQGYSGYDYVSGKNPVLLRMPEEPGRYDLTYMLNDSAAIITRPITVLPVGSEVARIPASLSAPTTVLANTDFPVGWSGPAAASDSVWLRRVGDSSWVNYAYLTDGNPLELRSPSEAGSYELVYKLGDEQDLVTRTLIVADPAAPVPVVIAADDGGLFNVMWSGVPAPDNFAAPEAWAMQEGVAGPVETAFAPGDYDILGDAGDQVFSARITVTVDGDNHFVIPFDPARSPAGPDSTAPEAPGVVPAGTAPVTPLPVTFRVSAMGQIVVWRATPLAGQDPGPVTTAAQSGIWDTVLEPGPWLIEGFDANGTGPLFAAPVEMRVDGPHDVTVPAVAGPSATPVMLPTDEIALAHCTGEVPCAYVDAVAGVQGVLMPEWAAAAGLFYTTAGGVTAEAPTIEFYDGTRSPFRIMAVLNPRQWDGMQGPCVAIDLGGLCAMTEADPAAIALLVSSLRSVVAAR